jgi:hypothetical protein
MLTNSVLLQPRLLDAYGLSWRHFQINEVPGSNLGSETDYHDLVFSWISLILQANSGIVS